MIQKLTRLVKLLMVSVAPSQRKKIEFLELILPFHKYIYCFEHIEHTNTFNAAKNVWMGSVEQNK